MYKIEIQRWIDWWKDSRKRWWTLVIMDAGLAVLQILQAMKLMDDGYRTRCVILSVCAGLLFYIAIRGVFIIRDINKHIAGLEEELLNENDNMV